LFTHRSHPGWILLANLTLFQAWFPQQGIFFSLNGVSWSLSVEMFFYVMFIFLRRLGDRYIYALAIAGYLCNFAAELSLRDAAQPLTHWMFYIFPVARLPEFLLGMSVFRLYRNGVLQRQRLPKVDFLLLFGLLILTAAMLRSLGVDNLFFYSSLPAPFAVAMIIFLLVEHTSAYMNHRLLVLLGESSFVLYLIHRQIVRLPLTYPMQLDWGYEVAMALGLVVVATALSVVGHLLLERNATKFARRGLLRLLVKDDTTAPAPTPS
jgi:peptidoglycan/LPS O-acetylase OafA/YrhL